jgi:hypothetical protein
MDDVILSNIYASMKELENRIEKLEKHKHNLPRWLTSDKTSKPIDIDV